MSSGKILIADKQGHFLIKLVGEVRVTLCISLDKYMQKIFKGIVVQSVTVDLTEVVTIDSTTLGLLTRMAQRLYKQCQLLMICSDKDIRRLINSMGLSYLFTINDTLTQCQQALIEQSKQLKIADGNQATVTQHVLNAHKALMELNDHNKVEFQDLVNALESE